MTRLERLRQDVEAAIKRDGSSATLEVRVSEVLYLLNIIRDCRVMTAVKKLGEDLGLKEPKDEV